MTTISDDDTVTDFYANIDVETYETLNEAFKVIAADPTLAMEVIEQVAYLTRHNDDEDPKDVELRDDCRTGLAEAVAFAMNEHHQSEAAKEAAEISALHQLGRFMLSEIDQSAEDEGLYALTSGIFGSLAESLAELGELTWTFGITDKALIEMAAADCIPPDHTPGALDRARSAMRDAGWLSWRVRGDVFEYTLTPPANWRELVKDHEAAIAAVERDALGGALQ